MLRNIMLISALLVSTAAQATFSKKALIEPCAPDLTCIAINGQKMVFRPTFIQLYGSFITQALDYAVVGQNSDGRVKTFLLKSTVNGRTTLAVAYRKKWSFRVKPLGSELQLANVACQASADRIAAIKSVVMDTDYATYLTTNDPIELTATGSALAKKKFVVHMGFSEDTRALFNHKLVSECEARRIERLGPLYVQGRPLIPGCFLTMLIQPFSTSADQCFRQTQADIRNDHMEAEVLSALLWL